VVTACFLGHDTQPSTAFGTPQLVDECLPQGVS
jgi:hypothetical protein